MNTNKTVDFDLSTTKQLLLQDCGIGLLEFRSYINPIISENRNISIEKAKNQQRITHTEVLIFYAKIGEDIRDIAAIRHRRKAG